MNDLISRQDAIGKVKDWMKFIGYSHSERNVMECTIQMLEELPSAQKTGKWLEAEQRDRTICSVCGYWQDLKAKFLFSFCPNCGSLMRGGYTNENISDS